MLTFSLSMVRLNSELEMNLCSSSRAAAINSALSGPKPRRVPASRAPSLFLFPLVSSSIGLCRTEIRSTALGQKISCKAQDPETDHETLVNDLRVPDHWLSPSRALQESEWLRSSLHKWLDDEYCPEPTNVKISKVAAESYYQSLVGKRVDLGDILLKMARDLESISYQESFHGAFSSANAAIDLISQRIELDGQI